MPAILVHCPKTGKAVSTGWIRKPWFSKLCPVFHCLSNVRADKGIIGRLKMHGSTANHSDRDVGSSGAAAY